MWQHTDSRSGSLAVSNQLLCSWKSKYFVMCISVYIEGVISETRHHVPHFYLVQQKYVWLRLVSNALPEEKALSWCLGFRWKGFPNNSHLSLYVNLLKTICSCLSIIRIKVCYLKNCVTGR
jgi:hypothetical protein